MSYLLRKKSDHMEYKLKSDESLYDYQIRLCKNKDLYDLTWTDVSELYYEASSEKKSPDVFRKFWRYFSEGYELAKTESPESPSIIEELEEKQLEFEKAKYQFQDQKREYAKIVREQARIDHIRKEMIAEIHKLGKVKPLNYYERVSFPTNFEREGLLVISDTHYGLFAQNHWNQFDNNEFITRMKKLITKTVEYSKNHQVKTLHVFLAGDLINGLIHQVTRINNTEDAVSQTMQVSEILAESLTSLANEVEELKIYNVRGNHDRVTPNKKDEIAKESFNDLIKWYLKTRLQALKNASFLDNKYDDEIIVTDILGNTVMCVHGHKDKVSNVTHNLTMMTRQIPDYIVMGHTHHHEENEDHSCEIIVNSSFSGVDDYAKDIRKTSKAAQKFIVFDKDERRLCTYSIQLDNRN